MAKTQKFKATANPERAKAMHGLRSSNAAQPHVAKPHKGARAANRRKALRDWS